jgi:DDE superfamily endonuclease/Helix-turn-helix of DDE superfamily endonuclease
LRAKPMTGLSEEQLDLLIERVATRCDGWQPPRGRRRVLGFAVAVTMTLVCLRHNLSQALLGALYGVSQPTVSRVLAALREPVGVAAADGMPGVAEAGQAERLLVDGTLCPTGNRAGQQGEGLYSGKRHRAGMNTLVISDRWGRLVDASDPTPGAMHDARSFTETGLDRLLADRDVVGDLGFLGCGVSTPLRKPPGGELWVVEQINNRAHNQARAPVERTIALLKQWRVLSGGYRGPLSRFPVTLRTVVALEKFRIYENPL